MNILHKLFTWIRKFFLREPEYQLEKLVTGLCGIDHEAVFKAVKEGDIIVSAMPLPLSKLAEIPENHRQRPYIVALKTEEGVYAYGGTSNKEHRFKHVFQLKRSEYHIWKDGNINLAEFLFIERDRIISIVDHLKTSDILKINREIILHDPHRSERIISLHVNITDGAVISYGGRIYYVYEVKDRILTVFPLVLSGGDIYVKVNECIYWMSISSEQNICFCDSVKLIGRVSHNPKKQIRRMKRKRENKAGQNRNGEYTLQFPIGQVFMAEYCRYMYVYTYNQKNYGVKIVGDEYIPGIVKINTHAVIMKDEIVAKEDCFDMIEEIAVSNKKLMNVLNEVLYILSSPTEKLVM